MGEADIIPLGPQIGTRGRPGRGTGREHPSSSSRDLRDPRGATSDDGGTSEPEESRPNQAAEVTGVVEPDEPGGSAGSTQASESQEADPAGQSPEPPESAGALGSAGDTQPPRATPSRGAGVAGVPAPGAGARRHPSAGPGIPVIDWLNAFTSASIELFGSDWEERLAQFLAFLRRRLTGDYSVDEYGFDAEITQHFFLAALRPIAEKWFRIEVRGIENVPAEGGALIVSNHSGTVPVDGLMTAVTLFDHTGRFLRPLGADLVFALPFVGEMARKGGATLACTEDAERMLGGGELVGVWPEGFKGIGKPFSQRYKLQRFGRGGFVSAAVRTGVPIVPTSVVGAEEIYPLVGNIPSLARLLGLPYLPITPLFPLLGPLGMLPLPSKWLISFGEPIRTDSYDRGAEDDPMLMLNITDQVRETIQQNLYALLMERPNVFGLRMGRGRRR